VVANPFNVQDSSQQSVASCLAAPSHVSSGTASKGVGPQPDSADQEYLQGVQCRAENQPAEAIRHYERAIALRPNHARAHNNSGVIQQERGDLVGATRAFQKAIESDPLFGLAWFNRGNCLREENRLSDAIAHYCRALALMPADAETRINLATVLREVRQFDASLALLDEIPPTSPHWPKAEFNRALVYFLRGEWGRGWEAYEARLALGSHARAIADCRWNGTPLGGRSILLLAEQGIGDQVMFASCLPDLVQQGANCFLECDARLVPLFGRSFPQITPFAKSPETEPLVRVGHCEVVEFLGTLPRFLRRRIEDFPPSGPVLQPDPDRAAKWRSSFARRGGAFKVGISWQGGRDAETRRRRSIPLALWEPIFRVPGVRWVNLQYGPSAAEGVEAGRRLGIALDDGTDCDPLSNLDDFAAKLAALDLVISVDNSTAHLAAAIGRPVWTHLPFASDWRWMLDRETTPWYPTMRLLRCQDLDQWSELMQKTARRLAAAVFSGASGSGAA
jgi:tetratricopeptide repeat protein